MADLKALVEGFRKEIASVRKELSRVRNLAEGPDRAGALVAAELGTLTTSIQDCQAEVAALPTWTGVEDRLAVMARGPSYVVAAGSNTYHRVASSHPLDGPEEHRTRCGWRFGLAPGTGHFDEPPPGKSKCKRRPMGCFMNEV